MSSGSIGDYSSNFNDYNPDVDSGDSDSSDSIPPTGNFNCMGSGDYPNACRSEGCKVDSDVETDNRTGCFESGTSNNDSSYNPQPLTKTKMDISEMQKLHPKMEEVTSRSSPECSEVGEIHESRKSVLSCPSSSDESLSSPEVKNGGNEAGKSFLGTAVLETRSTQCISEDRLVEKGCVQRESGTDTISEDLNAVVQVPCDDPSYSSADSSVEFPSNVTPKIHVLRFSFTDSSSSSSETESTHEDPVVGQALIRLSPSADSAAGTKHSGIRTDEATQFQNVTTNKLTDIVPRKNRLPFREIFNDVKEKIAVETDSPKTPEPSMLSFSGQSLSNEQSNQVLSSVYSNPEMPSHCSDTDLSKPITLTKEPVAARSAGFRTRFSLEMQANPIRHIVDRVTEPREVMRPVLTEQDFMDKLEHKLRNLSIRQLAEQSAEIFFPELQSKLLPPQLSFADFGSLLENTFGYLKSNAISWEKLFVDHICLPDNVMKTCLEQYRNIQIPQDLPSELRDIVTLRIQDYAEEYKARNAEIQRMEQAALESLTRKAANYYTEEMKYILGNNSFDPEILKKFHDEICQETQYIFLTSAALKHEHWGNMYKGILAEKIDREWKICIDLNNNNRRFLYSELQRLKEDCVNNYKITVDAEKTKREFNPKASMAPATFNNVGAAAQEEATKYFEKEVDLKIGNQNKQIIQEYREKFQNDINRLFKMEQKEILEIQPQEKELLEQKELESKQITSTPEGSEKVYRGRGRGSQFSANISKNANVEPGCSRASIPVPIVRGLSPKAVTLLPTFDLAIHFGLNRTRAGIYLPGTDQFQLYADVENCLYIEDEELLIQGSKNTNVNIDSPWTSFKYFILDHPVNKIHKIHVHGKLYEFRIEDFMSYLFANLKWRVERQLLATCPNCVVCVPQCLNEIQRKAVRDATTLAGFLDVKVINDTNAIALAYVMQNRFHSGDIVAVNTSEGFIDAAYFALEKGLIIRKAMSGKYFTAEVEPKFFSKAYWLKHQAVQENIKNVLKFKEEKKNEKAIRCESSHLVIVGSGEDASTIASVMSKYYQQTDCLDEEFPILGVAALARLQDFKFQKSDDPICKVWLECGPSDKLGERIQKFKGYLLSPGTNCNTMFLNCPTTMKGINLSIGVVQTKMQNFFLRQSRDFHLVIMDTLLFAINLKSRITDAHGLSDVKIQFLQRIEKIITKIQNLQRTVDGFSTSSKLKQELESLDARFFEVID